MRRSKREEEEEGGEEGYTLREALSWMMASEGSLQTTLEHEAARKQPTTSSSGLREGGREGGREVASAGEGGLPYLDESPSSPLPSPPSLPPSLPPYLPPQPVKKHRALPAPWKSMESAAAAREEKVRSTTSSSTPWLEAAAAAAAAMPPMLSPCRPTWREGGREGGRG